MALTLDGDNGISGINGSAATPAVQGTDTNTGLTFGTDTVGVVTGGSTRTTVDSSGRLLVGTSTARTNPDYFGTAITPQIQLEGTTTNGSTFSLTANSATDSVAPQLRLGKSSTGSVGGNGAVANNEVLGSVVFSGNDGTDFLVAAEIFSACDGTPSTKVPGRLQFYTGTSSADPAERMRIDSNGQTTATIGTSNGNYYVFSTVGNGTNCFRVRDNGQIYMGLASTSPYNSTTVAAANANLDSNGFFYRSTSSIKYKTDVEALGDSYADAILDCRPVWYRSTTGNDNPEWGYWGFIAEEVAEIDPRLVSWKTHELQKHDDGTEDVIELETPEPEGVQYDRFVPHLLNLIKRQQQAIETLETRVAQLEGGAS